MNKSLLTLAAFSIAVCYGISAQTPSTSNAEQFAMMQGIGPVMSGSETYAQLPERAKKFLDNNFKGETVTNVEKEFLTGKFEVYLQNGIEIEFTSQGTVDEIDGNGNALPAHVVKNILPSQVVTAIASTTSCDDIEKIDVERKGVYELDFIKSQKLRIDELKVDSTGKILRIER